jgi:6,7-dimethyl-8-ribityllumazine synthase
LSTLDAPPRATPRLEGPPARVLLIEAPYYAAVVGGMRAAATALLEAAGATHETVAVAGAFELPAALRLALRAGRHDGYLLLGCVVRGETDHYHFICDAVCQGVMAIAAATGTPIGFGLLTVATLAQAEARSAPGRHNKGAEAAQALLGQLALARHFAAP